MLLLLIATFCISMPAQMGPEAGQHMSKYDPQSEVTPVWTVDRVTQETGRRGWQGTRLFVKTETVMIEVHVGPADYIASQQFSLAAGDSVEVTGSWVKMLDQDVLLAREIKKEGKTLVLRNPQGVPYWSLGRRL
jgi:hypothetical protein